MLDGVAYYTGDLDTDLDRIEEILATPGLCSLDFETTIAKAVDREICTIQVTHESGAEHMAYVWPDGGAALRRVMRRRKARLVAHNALFEIECCRRAGVDVEIDCTIIAAKVLMGTMEGDKGSRTLWSLKALSERLLDKTRDKTIRERDWRLEPDAEAIEYGLDDTRDALQIWQILSRMFAEDNQAVGGYQVIANALPALAECNMHGLPFDLSEHDKLIDILVDEEANHVATLDEISCGEIANHGSPKQVGEWLIRVLMPDETGWNAEQRVPWRFSIAYQEATGQHWPLTKSGALSLNKGVVESRLETLTKLHPTLASYLLQRLQWSKSAKVRQAFGKSLQAHIDPLEDYPHLRGSLKPHGAQTSRMSMVDPNEQQMPAEERFRKLFKAVPGRKLVICDYGQIELRVGCLIAGDTAMQTIFAQGVDIHQASATAIKRLMTGDPDAVATPKERKQSKAPTFASLYGAQAPAVAVATGLPIPEAAALLDAWLETYPGIKAYRESAFDEAKEAGGVRLVSGQFIRMAPDTRPAQAINAPVQGSAASVMYLAMALVHRKVVEARSEGRDIWLAASIHDEIVLDCAEADAEYAAALLSAGMVAALLFYFPEAAKLNMATLADASVVDSWAEKA